jgi:tRNA G10  N-methylase Trm11
MRFDIDPQQQGVAATCSTDLPLEANSLGSIVFDPPFLTYVRAGRSGNGSMIMSNRFSGYWRYDELETHYRATLAECDRVLRKGGVLIFKCQDIIHNHRMHCTHVNVIRWAAEVGFRLKDLFVLAANHRMPSPNRAGKQKHARIFHSYFLVLEK